MHRGLVDDTTSSGDLEGKPFWGGTGLTGIGVGFQEDGDKRDLGWWVGTSLDFLQSQAG